MTPACIWPVGGFRTRPEIVSVSPLRTCRSESSSSGAKAAGALPAAEACVEVRDDITYTAPMATATISAPMSGANRRDRADVVSSRAPNSSGASAAGSSSSSATGNRLP